MGLVVELVDRFGVRLRVGEPGRGMQRHFLDPHLAVSAPDQCGARLVVVARHRVARVPREVERVAPGFSYYVCDERGCLRTRVNIFVGQERILDRTRLSDPVDADSRVLIMQALSGG